MVCGITGKMTEPDAAPGIDDEHAGKLPDVPLGQPNPVPFEHGRHPLQGHAGGQDASGGHVFQLEGTEEPLSRIRNHRIGHVKAFFESGGFFRSPEADQNHPGPGLTKRVLFLAQLRHLLPAKRSPVVSEEYENQRPVFPEPAQSRRGVVTQHHLLVADLTFIDGQWKSLLQEND
jgi:hypothetical protein